MDLTDRIILCDHGSKRKHDESFTHYGDHVRVRWKKATVYIWLYFKTASILAAVPAVHLSASRSGGMELRYAGRDEGEASHDNIDQVEVLKMAWAIQHIAMIEMV